MVTATNTPSNSVAIDPYWNHLHELESPKTPNYVAEVSVPQIGYLLTDSDFLVSRRILRQLGWFGARFVCVVYRRSVRECLLQKCLQFRTKGNQLLHGKQLHAASP